MSGVVVGIYIAERSGQPTRSVPEVVGLAGRGLRGDRHCRPADAPPPGPDDEVQDLSLVEAEVLESLLTEHGIELTGQETRRNVLTRGVRLNDLVGRRFTVGELLCEGVELCEPCASMQRAAGKPVLKLLVHRGGLRARILRGGTLRVGDRVAAIEAAAPA